MPSGKNRRWKEISSGMTSRRNRSICLVPVTFLFTIRTRRKPKKAAKLILTAVKTPFRGSRKNKADHPDKEYNEGKQKKKEPPPVIKTEDFLQSGQTWARFFRWGGVATSGWGGYIPPPKLQKISPAASKKKKKGRRFLRKVFYYVEKIAIPPPANYGRRYGGPWGGVYTPPHTPPPPTPMSCSTVLHVVQDIARYRENRTLFALGTILYPNELSLVLKLRHFSDSIPLPVENSAFVTIHQNGHLPIPNRHVRIVSDFWAWKCGINSYLSEC